MSNSRNPTRRCLVLIACIGLSTPLVAATKLTYKWLDDGGNVTYGDYPPKGVQAERIRISTGTSGGSSDDAMIPLPAGTSVAAAQPTVNGVTREQAGKLCEQARSNLEVLTNNALIRQTDDTGEVRILDETQKQEQMNTARDIIQSYCA